MHMESLPPEACRSELTKEEPFHFPALANGYDSKKLKRIAFRIV